MLDGIQADVFGEVAHQTGSQQAQVTRRGAVAGRGQAFGVAVAGGLHAQSLRLGVHHLDEVLHGAAHAFGQGHGRVIARLHDHALEQVFHAHLHLGVDKHARTRHLPSPLADRKGLLQIDFTGAQGIEDQVRGHQFGQGGRLHQIVLPLRGQHLSSGQVQQKIGLRGDFGGLWRLGCSSDAQRTPSCDQEIFHTFERSKNGPREERSGNIR